MAVARVALTLEDVPVNAHCVGLRWIECDKHHLAQLVALVAMGQALKAALIVSSLDAAQPDFVAGELCDEATIALTVQEIPSSPRIGYPRAQRDGFMFEVISWVAARQSMGENVVLKPPHISSTSQGVDGLMLELDPADGSIRAATIFEDKCTDNPRATFLAKVLPAFKDRHMNKRSSELVATASSLIVAAGIPDAQASLASGKILDKSLRSYRSSFAVSQGFDTEERRSFLFGRFEEIDNIRPDQRIGACLVIQGDVRAWFDDVASIAVKYLDSLRASAGV